MNLQFDTFLKTYLTFPFSTNLDFLCSLYPLDENYFLITMLKYIYDDDIPKDVVMVVLEECVRRYGIDAVMPGVMNSVMEMLFQSVIYEREIKNEIGGVVRVLSTRSYYCRDKALRWGLNTIKIFDDVDVLVVVLELISRIFVFGDDEVDWMLEVTSICFSAKNWDIKSYGVQFLIQLCDMIGEDPRLYSLYKNIYPLIKTSLDENHPEMLQLIVDMHTRLGGTNTYYLDKNIDMFVIAWRESFLIYASSSNIYYLGLTLVKHLISNPENKEKYLPTIVNTLFLVLQDVPDDLSIEEVSLEIKPVEILTKHIRSLNLLQRLFEGPTYTEKILEIIWNIFEENTQTQDWKKQFAVLKLLLIPVHKEFYMENLSPIFFKLCERQLDDLRVIHLKLLMITFLSDYLEVHEQIAGQAVPYFIYLLEDPPNEFMLFSTLKVALGFSYQLPVETKIYFAKTGFKVFERNLSKIFQAGSKTLEDFLSLWIKKIDTLAPHEAEFFIKIMVDNVGHPNINTRSFILHHLSLLCYKANATKDYLEILIQYLNQIERNINYHEAIMLILKSLRINEDDQFKSYFTNYMTILLSDTYTDLDLIPQILEILTKTVEDDILPYLGNILQMLKALSITSIQDLKAIFEAYFLLLKFVPKKSLQMEMFTEISDILLAIFIRSTDSEIVVTCVTYLQKVLVETNTTVYSDSEISVIILREINLLVSVNDSTDLDLAIELSLLNEELFKNHSLQLFHTASKDNFSFIHALLSELNGFFALVHLLNESFNESVVMFSLCFIIDFIKHYQIDIVIKTLSETLLLLDADISIALVQVKFSGFVSLAQLPGDIINSYINDMVEQMIEYISSGILESVEYPFCLGNAYSALGTILHKKGAHIQNKSEVIILWLSGINLVNDIEERKNTLEIFRHFIYSTDMFFYGQGNMNIPVISSVIEDLLSQKENPLTEEQVILLRKSMHELEKKYMEQ